MDNNKLVVLVINDMVIFPNNEIRIEYDRTYTNKIDEIISQLEKNLILLVNPINDSEDVTSLPNYGTLGRIKLHLNIPNGKTRIVIEGIERVKITNYTRKEDFYIADYKKVINKKISDESNYMNILLKILDKYNNMVPAMGNAINTQIDSANNLSDLCDLIAAFLPLSYDKKKKYITMINPIDRCKNLIKDINEELKFIKLEQDIEQEIEDEVEKSQKEYFLKEKIKAMQKELGEINSKEEEVTALKKKCKKLKCSVKIKNKINREISRYETINSNSPELGMLRDYLDWMLNLPWNNYTKDNNNLEDVKEILDSSHYGLEDVKERIIEYLAVKQNTNNLRSPILCLVGPPGVGKTSLAISIAKSLNRKVTKMSVGGINDEAEIIGHRRAYIGANPGRIIQGIRKAGTANPVFIIDEIDKMTKDIKGDPASSLLEVLDPEQNNKFYDHYIEEEFDLSQVFFIATANYIEQIPYELRDRLEIIDVSSYTEYEKLKIAKNHLIPKELNEHGLTSLQIQISDDAIMTIIRNYTKEAGVRELERVIATLLRKIVKEILIEKQEVFYQLDASSLEKYLGKKKYFYLENSKKNEVGIANGMAYTIFGGDILPIETNMYKGKGKLILTGSLGDVMQESCQIALSYIKANYEEFNIEPNLLEENNIHIHFPEGAVPKDGPSAGIAITTALISLFTNKPLKYNISMTGEITLRGRILAIGGLKEKVIGAHRAHIKTIFIPKENEPDLEDIPKDIKKDLKFYCVNNYMEVYQKIFK